MIGHYPAGFLMLVYLSEIDLPLVAPISFWSLLYLQKSICLPLLACTRCAQDNLVAMYAELTTQCQQEGNTPCRGHVLLRYMAWTQLEASRKQHEICCKRLKA